jgi:rhodanese-related sulfurtransferase
VFDERCPHKGGGPLNIFGKWLFVVSVVATATSCWAEVVRIHAAEVAKLQSQGVPVVDIRTPSEWKQTGIIPGAHLITVSGNLGNAAANWQGQLREVAPPNQPVILICQTGVRSAITARYLSSIKDYGVVYDASGGMSEWVSEKRPLVRP